MDKNEFLANFAESFDDTDPNEIQFDTKFRDLDEWSSLSVILVIAFFDMEFGKQIDNIAIREADTILDLYNLAIA